jgi:hypothetical protein
MIVSEYENDKFVKDYKIQTGHGDSDIFNIVFYWKFYDQVR